MLLGLDWRQWFALIFFLMAWLFKKAGNTKASKSCMVIAFGLLAVGVFRVFVPEDTPRFEMPFDQQ